MKMKEMSCTNVALVTSVKLIPMYRGEKKRKLNFTQSPPTHVFNP